jgi:hypothetical protein
MPSLWSISTWVGMWRIVRVATATRTSLNVPFALLRVSTR